MIIEPCHVPVPMVPTEVKLDPVTPEPRVVALSTDVPLISYTLPLSRLKSSEEVQAPVALTQFRVLSVVPFSVIPPPSAVMFVGEPMLPSSMFLSSTEIVVELIVVVVPLIVRLPVTTTSLLNVAVPVPEDEPKLRLVVEPAAPPVPMLIVFVVALATAPVDTFRVEAAVPV